MRRSGCARAGVSRASAPILRQLLPRGFGNNYVDARVDKRYREYLLVSASS